MSQFKLKKEINNEREEQRTWDDIASLEQLQIFISGGSKSSAIIANGNHQVAIDIFLSATDDRGASIYLPPELIYNNIELVDYANNPVSSYLVKSLVQNAYCRPLKQDARASDLFVAGSESKASTDNNGSWVTLYVSCNSYTNEVELGVKCNVRGSEYTTARENNYNSIVYIDSVSLQVYKKPIFTSDDLVVQYIYSAQASFTSGDPNESGNRLAKYYVKLAGSEIIDMTTHITETSKDWNLKVNYYDRHTIYGDKFYSYMQMNNHPEYGSSYTLMYEKKNAKQKKTVVTSKNTELHGICIWEYCRGALYNNRRVEGEPMVFIVTDVWGNEIKITARISDGFNLEFVV